MKTLIVEDDFTSRVLLQEILKEYGITHVAVNGREAVAAVGSAMDANEPYDLICLDILMPEMNGQETLAAVRRMENARHVPPGGGAKVIMTTVLSDLKEVSRAFSHLCDAYCVKPIDKAKLIGNLKQLGLI